MHALSIFKFMSTSYFIREKLQKGKEAKEKVSREFFSITLQQINWKPTSKSWSIGQCLEHLIIADSLYFPVLEKITEGNYSISFWEKWSPFTNFFGRFFVTALQEEAKTKMKTTSVFLPFTSDLDLAIVERFYKHHDTFMNFISGCPQNNLEEIIITSPQFSFVTYKLRDVLTFLVQHEHRHINQAIRVKKANGFPQ